MDTGERRHRRQPVSSRGLRRLPLLPSSFTAPRAPCSALRTEPAARTTRRDGAWSPCGAQHVRRCVRLRKQTCRAGALAGTVAQTNETHCPRLDANRAVKTAWGKPQPWCSLAVTAARRRQAHARRDRAGSVSLGGRPSAAGAGTPPRVCRAPAHVLSVAPRGDGLRLPSLCPKDKDAFEASGAGAGRVGSPPLPLLGPSALQPRGRPHGLAPDAVFGLLSGAGDSFLAGSLLICTCFPASCP